MKKIFVLCILIVLISGCSQNSPELLSELDILKAKVDSLSQQLSYLKFEQDFLNNLESIAYLTPGDEGYHTIECDLCKLTVKLEDVKAYANGCKVTIKLGNITYADINGLNGCVEWGVLDEKGSPNNETKKSRDFNISKSLEKGSWTNIELVLEGIPPNELGFVRIKKLSHTGISLITQ